MKECLMQKINLAYPTNIVVETTAHCQLRCKMCGRRVTKRKLGNMKQDLVFNILEQIADFNKNIRMWYCFLGEPLIIKKNLPSYIAYGKSLGIKSHLINTNGNLLDLEVSKKLITAGLTEIYIGLDAATEETYSKIRIGGNFEKVLHNIEELLKIKPSHLQVAVQMIEMEANRHEKQAFLDYWQTRDVKIFIKGEAKWIDMVEADQLDIQRYPCPLILDTLGIYWDGRTPFCVNDWDGRTVFSDIKTTPLKDIWAAQIRKFAKFHILKKWDEVPEICRTCSDWTSKKERELFNVPKDL